ncbi:hypothetical protein N431DRAFT_365872 [Stipitochalara longipes BDJ]|nr:hypothetical protein N431DRAFT_365872 [Stipitochalara longipes BDJ]
MLHRQRHVIRVGRDGSDELITAPFSEVCYVHLAREILHRIRPVDELLPGCDASDCDIEVELMPDFNLDFLMKIRGGPHPGPGDLEAFEAAAWYISRSLLVDREETFRCLAAHPYYHQHQENGKGIQCAIKQELVNFFDRRFTFQMGLFYGVDIPTDGALLRLGCDIALYEEDLVDCGIVDEATISEDNVQTWAALIEPIIRSKVVEPSVREKQNNVTLQHALTPISTKRHARVTESEISNFIMITKDALGPEALVVETGPDSDEAELSDTEDDATGRINNDSLSHISRRAGDILLE